MIVTDFNDINSFRNYIKGDVCFFCIGTTKKETSDNDQYRRVEYILPTEIAKIASSNKVNSFIYISSLGSSTTTNNTYLKNKADTEEVLKSYVFSQLAIIRPSLLLGLRKKFRLGEFLLQNLFKTLSFLFFGPLKKYKAIKSEIVSRAMVAIVQNNYQEIYFDSDKLHNIK